MSFDVYVERTQASAAVDVDRVARAIAERFGVPLSAIAEKLAGGRFRAKAGVAREKALRFAAELEALGAVCSVVASGAKPPSPKPQAPPPTPPVPGAFAPPAGAAVGNPPARDPFAPPPSSAPAAPSQPIAAAPSAPPLALARAPASPAAKSTVSQTGLMAAYEAPEANQSLGALDSGELKLSTIDGEDDLLDMPTPADGFLAADGTDPANPFAPPEENGGEEISLAVVSMPEDDPIPAASMTNAEQAAAEVQAKMASVVAIPAKPKRPPPGLLVLRALSSVFASDRKTFVVGAVLVAILGFIPAHLVASMWEGAAYSGINDELSQAYLENISRGQIALESMRAAAVSEMGAKRTFIAVVTALLWLAVCGGLAFVWYRMLDLDPLRARVENRKSAAESAFESLPVSPAPPPPTA